MYYPERDRLFCRQICGSLFGLLVLLVAVIGSGCGAAYHRDKYWESHFTNNPGYEDYVAGQLKTGQGWIKDYYDAVSSATATEDGKRAARNKVINGYLLLADTAYSKFEGGYNSQIAYFEIGSDLVNLGLTAASAVTPPAALLGAAAVGSLGVQHSVEKNGLNSQTRFVIINRMGAIRDKQRAIILARELEPVSCPQLAPGATGNAAQATIVSDICYTLEDAMRDVNQYFYLGTISHALADIDAQTQQIKQPQPQSTAPQITSPGSATFPRNSSGTFSVTTTGTPTPTVGENGALPTGVTFNAATGVLSGTPTITGTYNITFTAHNGVGADATQNFTLTVTP
jgi:hypothetical protein